jgi:hypothetical protein
MAAYAVVDFSTNEGTYQDALAELETQLETLDSTTNPIRLMDVIRLRTGKYVGLLIYDG